MDGLSQMTELFIAAELQVTQNHITFSHFTFQFVFNEYIELC